MFTGIVTAMGTIVSVTDRGDRILRVATDWDCTTLSIGASVAHSGICLTVLSTTSDDSEVAASAETMRVTTLGDWQPGERVNLERALRVGDELGGHIVSGHVDGLAEIISIEPVGDSHCVWLRAPEGLGRFVAAKGSVALDGVSLTVNEVRGREFSINVIDHTWAVTTLGTVRKGQVVNMEIDMLARYVARLAEGIDDDG